jgi:hypothetical protein
MAIPSEATKFLSWTIGGYDTFSPSAAFDIETMLSLAFEHRVSGRFLARIRRERPAWATDALLCGLEAQQHDNSRFVDQQGAALSTLRSRYLPGRSPIIVMKGIGYYARTRDEATLRRTLDLDIIVETPGVLVDTLRRDKAPEYRSVSPHELINAKIEGMSVDLHAYYPIWRTENVTGDWQTQRHGQGPYHHFGEVIVEELSFQAISDHAQLVDLFGLEGIYVPSPATSIIIICAHSYRDYISRSSVTMRTKPPIRFAEIAEICDFLSLPDFSHDELSALVMKFHAGQAVTWMAQFLAFHANDSRLADLVGVSPRKPDEALKAFPRAIWTGFFANIPASLTSFAISPVTTSGITETLFGARFQVTDEKAIVVDLSQDLAEPMRSVHVLGPPNVSSPVVISIRFQQDLLKIEIDARVLGCGPLSRVHVDVANFPWEWNWNRKQDKITSKRSDNMPEPHTSFHPTSDGYKLLFAIEPTSLGLSPTDEIAGFVAVGELKDGITIRAGTLFPFVLQRS